MQLARLRLVDDHEEVAADAVHVRLDQPEDRVRGDRGVDGVAAAIEDLGARLRRQWLARRDDPERRGDDRAAGNRKGLAAVWASLMRDRDMADATEAEPEARGGARGSW